MIDSEIVVGTGLRITVSRDELASRLAVVARGVSTRTTVLVLGGIQLRAEAGQLHLAATDMEVSLRATLDAQVSDEGVVVVPGRLLLDIARSLPDSDVTIEHQPEEAVVVVTSGTANYRLHTYSSEDFPRLPEVEHRRAATRSSATPSSRRLRGSAAARRATRAAPFSPASSSASSPASVVMAATDSYRLAVKETPVEAALPDLEAIIPARALQELSRIATGADEVQLGLLENHVVFGADGTWLTTRRIDGQFPNYRQLLPEQFEHELLLPREELLEVVRRVSLMAQRNSPLRLRFAEGELTVSAVTQDVGEARESLPAPFAASRSRSASTRSSCATDSSRSTADTIKFKLISPLRPAVLEGETPDYVYLIMPIRLAG